MIIYDSGLVKLNYDPSTDILFVDFPLVDSVFPTEIGSSFQVIVDHVRNYDIKKLLIDAQKAQAEVPSDDLRSLISEFIRNLSTTRLQKIARVESPSTNRENAILALFRQNKISFQYRSFSNMKTAENWLNEL